MSYDAFQPRSASARDDLAAPRPTTPPPPSFAQIQAGPAIATLRGARRPAVAVLGAVLGLYLLNPLLAVGAPGLVAVRLFGSVNVGMALSLLLGALSLTVTYWHGRRARRFDPLAAQVRATFEREEER
ncbi:DUF485 domain-containing protein [Streptomyces cinnabarinus]|uniref:DUF485 domain-containing protein n=1 Tax=Streptomyces cinnabarinus TaxID=67287 RepID=A0ABY7KP72_9ACTN|nr:DUF485 domain-containing protein [Streptomyces cinnabarinus]WAZ26341.1 DUF485 domain-containing protein [Streptomyces cinnabarinus]